MQRAVQLSPSAETVERQILLTKEADRLTTKRRVRKKQTSATLRCSMAKPLPIQLRLPRQIHCVFLRRAAQDLHVNPLLIAAHLLRLAVNVRLPSTTDSKAIAPACFRRHAFWRGKEVQRANQCQRDRGLPHTDEILKQNFHPSNPFRPNGHGVARGRCDKGPLNVRNVDEPRQCFVAEEPGQGILLAPRWPTKKKSWSKPKPTGARPSTPGNQDEQIQHGESAENGWQLQTVVPVTVVCTLRVGLMCCSMSWS